MICNSDLLAYSYNLDKTFKMHECQVVGLYGRGYNWFVHSLCEIESKICLIRVYNNRNICLFLLNVNLT